MSKSLNNKQEKNTMVLLGCLRVGFFESGCSDQPCELTLDLSRKDLESIYPLTSIGKLSS